MTTLVVNEVIARRAEIVRTQLRTILELAEWAKDERESPPDTTALDVDLSLEKVEANKVKLRRWATLFDESLSNYAALLALPLSAWWAFTPTDFQLMGSMVEQAVKGIKLWI